MNKNAATRLYVIMRVFLCVPGDSLGTNALRATVMSYSRAIFVARKNLYILFSVFGVLSYFLSRHNKKKVILKSSKVRSFPLLFLLLFITLKSKNFCDDVNDITTTTVGRRRGVRDFRDDDDEDEEQNKSLVVECRPTARRRDDRLASFTSSSSSQTAGVVVIRTLSRRDKNVWVVGRLRGCGDDDGNELR